VAAAAVSGAAGPCPSTSRPSTGTPNDIVAAFWDDLNSVTGLTSVRYNTYVSAPNRRFTVEWKDFTFFSGAGERLTFQAQLFESTNVVEVHHCSMAANTGSATRTTGDSATVGLENVGGTDATRYEYNTANTVVSGGGLRFTPQP
jgi:hypothetical protein